MCTEFVKRNMPLPAYTPCMRGNDGSSEDSLELVSQYFKQGYNNLEILEFLKLHGTNISLSTLKRRLTSLGLSRKNFVSDDELRIAIEKETWWKWLFCGIPEDVGTAQNEGNYGQKS